MNKVYKTIWSKARNCYVVVSEFAKTHVKSSASDYVSRAVIMGVLAIMSSFAISSPTYAALIFTGESSGVPSDFPAWQEEQGAKYTYFQISTEDKAKLDDFLKNNFPDSFPSVDSFGNKFTYKTQSDCGFMVDKHNNFYYVFRLYANSSWSNNCSRDIVIPFDEIASLGLDTSFLKYGVQDYNHFGNQRNVNVSSVNYGVRALAKGNDSVALGTDAVVNEDASDSVALGSGSIAESPNLISVGNDTLKRRIINVADGVDDNDVVNVKQLNHALRMTGSNGAYGSVGYDTASGDIITLAGETGTKLTNLKPATLNASSTDAVIGAQLYATNQNILGFASDITRNKENIRELNTSVTAALESVSSTGALVDAIDTLKADASLNNLTAAGKNVIATAAVRAVQEYMSANPPTIGLNNSNSNTLLVMDAGNGSLHVGEGSSVNGTSSIAIGTGNQVNANNAGAFGDPSIINADGSYVLGNDDTVNTGAVNSFIVGNDSVSNAEGSLIMGSHVTSNGKNGMALGNSSKVSAENAIALGYASVADEENTLSIGNSTLKRRITNMADGNLVDGSSDAVTGSQLYATNERVKANEEAITKKADVDASNIDIDKWTEKLGTGKIEEGNGGLVTGGTVYDAVTNMKDAITNASPIKADGDNIYIGADMGGNTISVANNKGDGRVITGVATNPQDASSAANVGYVNAVGQNIVQGVSEAFTRVNDRMDKVGAGAAAMAGLVPGSFEEDTKWNLSASVGNYRSATAGAVGAFYKPTGNVTIALKGAFGNGENMVSGGIGVALNKGDIPGVTKRQLAAEVVSLKARIERLEAALLQAQAGRK